MTLIASIYDGSTVFAFGDLLITKNHRFGGVGNVIPGVWKDNVVPDIHVANLRRKVCSLGPGTILLWSGVLGTARALYRELSAIMNDANRFKRERFSQKLQDFKNEKIAAQLIFTDYRNVVTLLHVNCETYNIPKLGSVVIAGTGRDDFLNEIGTGEIASQIAKIDTPFHKAAFMEHILLKSALWDASEAVQARWGGGIETFFNIKGGFLPLEYVVHSFVEAKKIPGGWLARPHAYTTCKRYVNDGEHYGPNSELAIMEIDRFISAKDYHVVPPIYTTNERRLKAPDSSFASPLSTHYFIGIVSSMTEDGIGSRTLMLDAEKLVCGLKSDTENDLYFELSKESGKVIEEYVRTLVSYPDDPKPDRILFE